MTGVTVQPREQALHADVWKNDCQEACQRGRHANARREDHPVDPPGGLKREALDDSLQANCSGSQAKKLLNTGMLV